MNKKRRKPKLVPRLGPPENLRPAGAHESKKRYNRKRQKAALVRNDEDGFFCVSHWSAGNTPILEDRYCEPLPCRANRDVD
jgi:hypothetical protein